MKKEASRFSEKFVSYHNTTWRHNPEVLVFSQLSLPTMNYKFTDGSNL
jgi:hypothetical protein